MNNKNYNGDNTMAANARKDSHRPRQGILEAYLENQAILRGYLSRFLVSSHEIDDVSQEAFLRAYSAEKKKSITEPKAFIFRIAKNLVLSDFRKARRRATNYTDDIENEDLANEQSSLEDNVIAQQHLGIYCEAIATLPPKRRRVLLMKKIYGLSHKEIARRMGTSVSAVEKHLLKGGRQCLALIAARHPDMETGKIVDNAAPQARGNNHEV